MKKTLFIEKVVKFKLNPIDYDVLSLLAEDQKRQYFSTRQEAGVDLRQMLKSRGHEEKKTAYSIQKLRKYELISNVRRGVYKITIKGRHVFTDRRKNIDKYQEEKYKKIKDKVESVKEGMKDELATVMDEYKPVEQMTVNEIRIELNRVRDALNSKARPSYEVRQIYRNRVNELSTELQRRKQMSLV